MFTETISIQLEVTLGVKYVAKLKKSNCDLFVEKNYYFFDENITLCHKFMR
jgi:hypothetical protein